MGAHALAEWTKPPKNCARSRDKVEPCRPFSKNHIEEPKQPLISLDSVARHARRNGWTVDKKYAFIAALAEAR